MKRTINVLLISLLLISCRKEKMVPISGSWQEIGNYIKNSSGEFYWESASRFPLTLVLNNNSDYYAFNDVPAGSGIYEYNYSTKELRLTNNPSGNISICRVSLLDENYMIIDYVYNNELMRKVKFSR
jgi:hypothetical protein